MMSVDYGVGLGGLGLGGLGNGGWGWVKLIAIMLCPVRCSLLFSSL
jgi:hypothetical protein